MTPQEEHLLASVDGSLTSDELAFITGQTPERVDESLECLAVLGLVSFKAADSLPPEPPKPESVDGIDLAPEKRKWIDDMFARLESTDFYGLLDLARDCSKTDVKKAYYKLGPKFHPDRHYRKQLGPYKQKIEQIFTTLTKAHDTLRDANRRAAYDRSMPALKPGSRIKRSDATSQHPPARPSQPRAQPGPSPSVPPPRRSQPPKGGRPSRPRSAERDSRPSQPEALATPPAPPLAPAWQRVKRERGAVQARSGRDRAAARDAMARKLGQPAASPATTPAARSKVVDARTSKRTVSGSFDATSGVQQSAAEMIRARFDKVGDVAREKRYNRYLDEARAAQLTGDFATAVTAYEQALLLNPGDSFILTKIAEAKALRDG